MRDKIFPSFSASHHRVPMTESRKQPDKGRRQAVAFVIVCAAVIAARVYLGAIRGTDLRSGWRLPEMDGHTAALVAGACLFSAAAARLGRMYFNPAAATLLAAAAGGLTTAGDNALVGVVAGGMIGLLITSRIARRIALALLASLAAVAFGVLSGSLALWLDRDLSDGPSVATVLAVVAALATAIVFRWRSQGLWCRRERLYRAAETATPQMTLRGGRAVRLLGSLALLSSIVAGFWLSLSVDFVRRMWKVTGYVPFSVGERPREVGLEPLSWDWLWPGPLGFKGQLLVLPDSTTDDDLRALRGWTRLQSLTIHGDNITDAGLDCLTGLTSLTDLSLHSSKITDRGLIALGRLPALGRLELERSRVTGQGLNRFASAGQLYRLRLKGARLSDDDLHVLRRFSSLFRLSLAATDITDEGLRHLEPLDRLSDLDLSDTKITKHGLEILLSLPTPLAFSARNFRPTAGGMGWRSCDLNLARTRLTDDDLRVLTRFASIYRLTLDGNPITDEAMSILLQISDLSFLSLADTQITDAAIADFESMASLRSLDLRGTRVTEDGVNRLRALKPSIVLNHDD